MKHENCVGSTAKRVMQPKAQRARGWRKEWHKSQWSKCGGEEARKDRTARAKNESIMTQEPKV